MGCCRHRFRVPRHLWHSPGRPRAVPAIRDGFDQAHRAGSGGAPANRRSLPAAEAAGRPGESRSRRDQGGSVGRYHPSITDGSSALSGQWLPPVDCLRRWIRPWNSGIPAALNYAFRSTRFRIFPFFRIPLWRPANKATAWPPCSWVELQAVLDRPEFWVSQLVRSPTSETGVYREFSADRCKSLHPRISRE